MNAQIQDRSDIADYPAWLTALFMPMLPVTGTSLSPLAQWIVIPLAAFWWARRRSHSIPLTNGN